MRVETKTTYHINPTTLDEWEYDEANGEKWGCRNQVLMTNIKKAMHIAGINYKADAQHEKPTAKELVHWRKSVPLFIRADMNEACFTEGQMREGLAWLEIEFSKVQDRIAAMYLETKDADMLGTPMEQVCKNCQNALDVARQIIADWLEAFEYLKADIEPVVVE